MNHELRTGSLMRMADAHDEDPFLKIRRELEAIPDADEREARLLELGELKTSPTASLPDVDDYDERLRALHEKTSTAREMREAQVRQAERKASVDQETYRGLGNGLQIAYAIIGVPVAFILVGFLLDRPTGGNTWKSVLGVVGCVVGISYAVWALNRRT